MRVDGFGVGRKYCDAKWYPKLVALPQGSIPGMSREISGSAIGSNELAVVPLLDAPSNGWSRLEPKSVQVATWEGLSYGRDTCTSPPWRSPR